MRVANDRPVRKTVDELCLSHPKLDAGLKVLNIGFGLGIVREFRPVLRDRV